MITSRCNPKLDVSCNSSFLNSRPYFEPSHSFRLLINSGDGFDSDGDGSIDICEDNYPPTLLIRNRDLFRCDIDNIDKLCYHEKTFKSFENGETFLRSLIEANDDCANFEERGIKINHEANTKCQSTEYSKFAPLNV